MASVQVLMLICARPPVEAQIKVPYPFDELLVRRSVLAMRISYGSDTDVEFVQGDVLMRAWNIQHAETSVDGHVAHPTGPFVGDIMETVIAQKPSELICITGPCAKAKISCAMIAVIIMMRYLLTDCPYQRISMAFATFNVETPALVHGPLESHKAVHLAMKKHSGDRGVRTHSRLPLLSI